MQRFELELLGGATERRYRRSRPEVDAMPWSDFDPSHLGEAERLAERMAWTSAAFQEHRTGVMCARALGAMIEARAPIDLVAVATRFPLDEMVHVELCARMAMLLGGATEILYEPDDVVDRPDASLSPVLRAAELVVDTFCVGESLSIPLLRGAARAAMHPLPRAILSRIVRDEAAHGVFGFTYLDWAAPTLDDDDRHHLARSAADVIVTIELTWEDIRSRPPTPVSSANSLGWMHSDAYLALAAKSLEERVIRPLTARGIDPLPHLPELRQRRTAA